MNDKSRTKRKQTDENLMKGEQHYQLLIENIPSVVWVTARDGKTVFISENVEKVYGYTPGEILSGGNKLWFDRIHPDDKALIKEAFEQLFSNEKEYKIEYRIQRKDGEWIWLLDSANMVANIEGQLLAYGVFSDVTERKQAEKDLQESERKHRLLFEEANDGIFIIQDSCFIDCNTRVLEMFKAERENIIGKRPHEISPAFQPNGKRTAVMEQEMLKGALLGERQFFEWRHRRSDNTEFDVEVSLNLLELDNEKFVQAIVRDITDRKITEFMLQESEDRFRRLSEATFEGIAIIEKGTIIDANTYFAEMFGYTFDEVIGLNVIDLVAPEDREMVQERSTSEYEEPYEYRAVRKDRSSIFVEVRGKSLPYKDRTVRVTAIRDITERKLAENDLQRVSQDEIRRREELEKLRVISASMRQAEGSSSLLQVFTRELQELCQADVISSMLYKTPQSPVTSFAPEEKIRLSQEQSDGITIALLNTKTGNLPDSVPGFESVLILPLQSSDKVHGAVLVASRAPDAFTPDEQNMLNAVADMAGTALHRIDILETLEERVQQRTHDLVVLYNLITIISENWRLQDLLELSLVLTLETVKADRGIIYLTDGKESPGLKPVIQRGFSDGFQVEVGSLPDDELARIVSTQQKHLSLESLVENPDYANFKELNSYVGIPIMVRGDMRGVFSLFANEKKVFGPDEIALLTSIADHLGIGIENSILWEQSRENAAIEERNRLARNLHDSVSQLLYSLTLMAGTTKKMLDRDPDLDAVKKSVARFGDTAHQALKEMRLLLYELRPAVLDSEGLVSALKHRIGTVEERLGVKVNIQAKGLPDLPSDMEDALYHIALEALNNIVKHAESKTASIKITRAQENIVMEISDEGRGFDPNGPRKGQGLRNMQERGQMLGGEVVVDSKPGEGTRVMVKANIPSGSLVSS